MPRTFPMRATRHAPVQIREHTTLWLAGGVTLNVRHVRMLALIRPHPYVRTVHSARHGNPSMRRYAAWRGATRDQLRAALVELGTASYPPNWWLGVAVSAGASPQAPTTARRRKDGKPDGRTVTGILDWDADNVWKAVLDVCNGLLWRDDRQIRVHGPGAFFDESNDWLAVHVWGTPKPYCEEWRPEWQRPERTIPSSVPPSDTEPEGALSA